MTTTDTVNTEPQILKRVHAKRLREMYRSAGWPFQDVVEIELLAAGLLERVQDKSGVDCMRVTDTGIEYLAAAAQTNRSALSAHNALVDQVALTMARDGGLFGKTCRFEPRSRAKRTARDAGACAYRMFSPFATAQERATWNPSWMKSRSAALICWVT